MATMPLNSAYVDETKKSPRRRDWWDRCPVRLDLEPHASVAILIKWYSHRMQSSREPTGRQTDKCSWRICSLFSWFVQNKNNGRRYIFGSWPLNDSPYCSLFSDAVFIHWETFFTRAHVMNFNYMSSYRTTRSAPRPPLPAPLTHALINFEYIHGRFH